MSVVDLAALNERVRVLKDQVAWYAAAVYREDGAPSEGDNKRLAEMCAWLDEAQAAASAHLDALEEAES